MHRTIALTRTLLLAASAAALAGCLSGSSPNARFYMLQPIEAGRPTGSTNPPPALMVGPVDVAAYLARPQIARRVTPHEIAYDEFARWAEPLDRGILRALSLNLGQLLGTDRIYSFPYEPSTARDADVSVEILRLEATPGGGAILEARWQVRDGRGGGLGRMACRQWEIEVGGRTIEEMVAAESALIGDMSRDIADAIRELTPRP